MNLHPEAFLQITESPLLSEFVQALPWSEFMTEKQNQNIVIWRSSIENILQLIPAGPEIFCRYNSETVSLENGRILSADLKELIVARLRALMPWRKGPFNFFGIPVDTEWRSDLKWARLENSIQPLSRRTVLDIGCGSGYHLWRMRGAGAKSALGIEPYLLSVMQFLLFRQYLPGEPVLVLPMRIENFPGNLPVFDTVFSMGVLYHQRSPFEHLFQLRSLLRPEGELVLETLVIDGKMGEVLVPADRYAKMRNVWFIPSPLTLESWLKRSGFRNIDLINIAVTTSTEQRRTAWMEYESLDDFLDPQDKSITIEGYPAPMRAIFTATL